MRVSRQLQLYSVQPHATSAANDRKRQSSSSLSASNVVASRNITLRLSVFNPSMCVRVSVECACRACANSRVSAVDAALASVVTVSHLNRRALGVSTLHATMCVKI